MSFKHSILTRWIAQPAQVLQRSMRAAPSTALPFLRRQPFLAHQIASQSTRRALSTTTRRATTGPRPGLRSVQLPKQRLNRRFNSGSSNSGSQAKEGNSLSQRLRKLSREYGWATLGVYLALSALDFPFCFAAVRLLGVDRIGHLEHVVIQWVKETFKTVWPQTVNKSGEEGEDEADQGSLVRAEERNQEEASIWTQLALAYAIHKSFIFIRVPLTAAVTPKVVKVLRRWGWDIGKRKPKSP